MARRVETFTITSGGANRDNDKTFVLTEMSADQGWRWVDRLVLACTNAGGTLPDGIAEAGFAGLAAMGFALFGEIGKLPWEKAEPLLEELLGCVQYQPPDTRLKPQALMRGNNCQIEEISTFMQLHWAVLKLHLGFSPADDIQI